jgi:hypothetical protein
LIRSNTSKSDSTAINDTVDVLEVIKERKALQERMRGHSRQRSNGSLRKDEIPKRQPPTMKIDTTIDRSNSPVANISIPSRKESRNWNSGDSPAQKQLNIIPGLKSPAYPILLSPFSASLDRDSSNRSAESRSHSRSNSDSLHRSKSGSDKISDSYPSLGRDRNTLIKESLGTLLKATKRRESPSDDMNREEIIDQSLDTIRRGTAKRMHQSASDNTPTLDYDHLDEALTLRIVLSTSQPLYLTVERTISFDQVLDQVSTLIAESRPSRKWRMLPPPREYMVAVQHLSYRTPDLDLVTIHSDQDWDLCRYHARQIEKLTLFVTVHEHK